jgi:ech hydrogenase subunit F
MFEMTKNVLQNLMGKTSTRLYPFTKREPFAGFRGTLDINVEECIFCGTCAKKCPSQCIEVDVKGRTWTCDSFACVYCSVCVEACPTQCMTMYNVTKPAAGEKDLISYKGKPKEPKKPKVAKEENPAG